MKPLTEGGWVVLTPTQAIILVMKYLNGINLVAAQWHDLNKSEFLKLHRLRAERSSLRDMSKTSELALKEAKQ